MSMHDLERKARLMDNFRHRAFGFAMGVVFMLLIDVGMALLWE